MEKQIKSILLHLPILFVGIIFIGPILYWFGKFGFNLSIGTVFRNYDKCLTNTLIIVLISASVSTLISYFLVYYWWRYRNDQKIVGYLPTIMILILVSNIFAKIYSWFGLTNINIVSQLLSVGFYDSNNFGTSLLSVLNGMIYLFIPIGFFMIYVSFLKLNKCWINFSYVTGASKQEIFVKIIYEHTKKTTLICFLFICLASLGYYMTPYVLSGGNYDMVGNLLWKFSMGNSTDRLSEIVTVILLISVIPIIIILRSNEWKIS